MLTIDNDNTQDWFDNKTRVARKIRETFSKKFKKPNFQINYNFCIEAKYNTQKLTKQKKTEFFNTKWIDSIGKTKELWKFLKALGLASIKKFLNKHCFKTKDVTNFDDKKIITKNFLHSSRQLTCQFASPFSSTKLWRK